jgi:hypothetical protein
VNEDVLLVRSAAVLERSYADEVLLASPAGGDVHRLEGTAAVVWDLLGEPRSFGDLVGTLAGAFGEPRERIAGDVGPMIADLTQRGWLAEVNG